MSKKIILTSIVAVGFVCPAFAVPTNTSATFPQDGYMLEDYTYTGAATSTNLGVTSGSVNANAEYESCPANSYCDGQSGTPTACSTVGDHSYTLSAAGSSAATDCYRACTVANANIAHASAVSGNAYYGAGTNTCTPTACESGYTLTGGSPDLMTLIGASSAGSNYAAINNSGNDMNNSNASTYNLSSSDHNSFAVDYGSGGVVRGHGRCSTRAGDSGTWDNDTYNVISSNFVDSLTDETGQTGAQYCYCGLDSYTPQNGSAQSLSGPWVFLDVNGGADDCAVYCAFNCAGGLLSGFSDGLAFRSAVFGSLGATPATCDANVISITWGDASAADIAANEAGTCTYGGDIRTPVAATAKPGKRFKGWVFAEPEETSEQK